MRWRWGGEAGWGGGGRRGCCCIAQHKHVRQAEARVGGTLQPERAPSCHAQPPSHAPAASEVLECSPLLFPLRATPGDDSRSGLCATVAAGAASGGGGATSGGACRGGDGCRSGRRVVMLLWPPVVSTAAAAGGPEAGTVAPPSFLELGRVGGPGSLLVDRPPASAAAAAAAGAAVPLAAAAAGGTPGGSGSGVDACCRSCACAGRGRRENMAASSPLAGEVPGAVALPGLRISAGQGSATGCLSMVHPPCCNTTRELSSAARRERGVAQIHQQEGCVSRKMRPPTTAAAAAGRALCPGVGATNPKPSRALAAAALQQHTHTTPQKPITASRTSSCTTPLPRPCAPLTRSAYRRVLMVCSQEVELGETFAIMTVRAFVPMKESRSTSVSLLPRKGMCLEAGWGAGGSGGGAGGGMVVWVCGGEAGALTRYCRPEAGGPPSPPG